MAGWLLSASCQDFPLWHTAPVLTLSEEKVIHQFGGLLLDRSGNEQQDAKLSVQEHECLQSMRIQTRPRTGASAETEWHWTGVDRGFPQQNNGKDCGMTVIAAAAHLARGWQTPPMNENSMNQYRWWLCSAITEDSKIATPVSCSHCGTRLYRTTPSYTRCVDLSQCEQVRNESDDEDAATTGEPLATTPRIRHESNDKLLFLLLPLLPPLLLPPLRTTHKTAITISYIHLADPPRAPYPGR